MARALPTAMDTALAADSLRLIYLIEMALTQGTYRYALAATSITFDGAVYLATAGGFSEMAETTDRGAASFRLTLQNADGVLGPLLDGLGSGADARGKRITLRAIEETTIADATAVVTDVFAISDYRILRDAVAFSIGSPMATAVEAPHRTLGATRCPWVYRSAECGSLAAPSTCGKTIKDCQARFDKGEALRFGGTPARVRSRRRLYL